MKVHRGKITEKAVRESGMSLTALANKLSVSRRTLYNYFSQPDLAINTMFEIGKIIHLDFSQLLPKENYVVNSSGANQVHDEKLSKDAVYWKEKYFDLLEKHNELLTQQLSKKK